MTTCFVLLSARGRGRHAGFQLGAEVRRAGVPDHQDVPGGAQERTPGLQRTQGGGRYRRLRDGGEKRGRLVAVAVAVAAVLCNRKILIFRFTGPGVGALWVTAALATGRYVC